MALNSTLFKEQPVASGLQGEIRLVKSADGRVQYAFKTMNDNESYDKEKTALDRLRGFPHVVQTVDIGNDCEHDNSIPMKYYENGELFSFMEIGGGLPEKLAKAIFVQLLEGLRAIHSQGVAHRDLKAENIFVDESFSVVIGDFGLSATFDAEKNECLVNNFCGTRPFIAPEVHSCCAEGKPYDARLADIWSLGCLLFQMLTGNNPFSENHATSRDWYFAQIKKGKHASFWKQHEMYSNRPLTEEAKNFLEKVFIVYPSDRPQLDDLLSHPWLVDELISRESYELEMSLIKRALDALKGP